MKWVKVCILILLLTSTLCVTTPSSHAMVEKEDEEFYVANHFGFKVKRIIATEADGTMVLNKDYEMTIIVTLTYINKDLWWYFTFNFSEMSIDAPFMFSTTNAYYGTTWDAGASTVFSTVIRYNQYVKTPTNIVKLRLVLPYYGYYNPWKEEVKRVYECEPVYIVLRNKTFQEEIIDWLNSISNLLYVLILLTATLTISTIYLSVRKHRSKNEEER